MKDMMNKVLTFFVLLLCVLAFVSCDSAVSESGEALVRFGEADGSSRGISSDDLEGYTVDSLYWAYVAVKKDGLHTVGESEVTTTAASADYSKIVTVDGKNYILRPVRPDYEPGLNVDVGPFSYGDWLFRIYGFKSCDGTEFADLVYTGDTVGYSKTPKVYERITRSTTAVSVGFELSPATGSGTAFPTTGTLVFGSLYYTVPKNMKFYAGTTFTITFKDASNSDKVVATATGDVTADSDAGVKIPLSITYGAASAFDSGVQGQFNTPASSSYQAEHKFKVEVVYQSGATTGHLPEPVTLSSSTRVFPVLFTAGNLTVLYGDIDDVVVDNGKSEVDNFGPVCRIGDIYYTSLTDAVAACSETAVIEVIRNIDYGGVFSKNFKICPVSSVVDGGVVGNNRCYVKNITMASGKKVEFIAELTETASIGYTGVGTTGSTLNFISWSNGTCFVDTNGGTLTVNNSGTNLYHTGSCGSVTVTDVKKDKTNGLGYHCWVKVTGTLSAADGYVELGATADVATLTTTSNNVVLTGKPTTKVGNMSAIYEGTSLTYKTPYKKVTFDGNGGKFSASSSDKTIVRYGIEGMYLPDVIRTGVFGNGSSKRQTWWASSSAGAGPLYWCDITDETHGNANYVVPSIDSTLYAYWEDEPLLPIGGYVFAFASGGTPCTSEIKGGNYGDVKCNGVIYQFFDKNGIAVNVKDQKYKVVNSAIYKDGSTTVAATTLYSATGSGASNSLLTALKDKAMYYRIINKPASGYKDGVYVCPKDGYADGYLYSGNPLYWGGDASTTHYVVSSEPAFGQGKIISSTVKAYSDVYTCSGSNATIWSYLDWLNGGVKPTTGTTWGAYTDSTIPAAKKEAMTCSDWFIPVVAEIGAMHKSGVLPNEWFAPFDNGTGTYRRHIKSCCELSSVNCDNYVVDKIDGSYIRTGSINKTSGGASNSTIFGAIYCRSF